MGRRRTVKKVGYPFPEDVAKTLGTCRENAWDAAKILEALGTEPFAVLGQRLSVVGDKLDCVLQTGNTPEGQGLLAGLLQDRDVCDLFPTILKRLEPFALAATGATKRNAPLDALGEQVYQLTEMVTTGLHNLDQRLRGLEDDAAELRGLLKAVATGIERINTRLPADYNDPVFEVDDLDDESLTPPPGQLIH